MKEMILQYEELEIYINDDGRLVESCDRFYNEYEDTEENRKALIKDAEETIAEWRKVKYEEG